MILHKKIRKKSNSVVVGLMDYLKETGEERLLPEVADELEKVLKESKRAKEVVITSAIPLTNAQREDLRLTLGKHLNLTLPFVNKVDKKLIGGFTVQVADWFLDASISHQLEVLKNNLLTE